MTFKTRTDLSWIPSIAQSVSPARHAPWLCVDGTIATGSWVWLVRGVREAGPGSWLLVRETGGLRTVRVGKAGEVDNIAGTGRQQEGDSLATGLGSK
jgi:hypothetical protein